MKEFKTCQIVLLPTEESSPLFIINDDNILRYNVNNKSTKGNFHLYILSNDKIVKGDYFYNTDNNSIQLANDNSVEDTKYWDEVIYFKVIATTDESLELYSPETLARAGGFSLKTDPIGLPKPSQSFVLDYVNLYNAGTPITEVNVEYFNEAAGWQSLANHGAVGSTHVPDNFIPSVNENQIIIQSPVYDYNGVKIISYCGYWHLHRELNGKHYLGHSDNRIGLSIKSVKVEEIKDWTTRQAKIKEYYIDDNGKSVSYIDEPYTESQITSFANLTEEKLEEWVKQGY